MWWDARRFSSREDTSETSNCLLNLNTAKALDLTFSATAGAPRLAKGWGCSVACRFEFPEGILVVSAYRSLGPSVHNWSLPIGLILSIIAEHMCQHLGIEDAAGC